MTAALAGPGALVLVPNALDFGAPTALDLQAALPLAVMQRSAQLEHWLVEDAKSARAFLKRVGAVAALARPLQELDIRELPRTGQANQSHQVAAAQLDKLLAPAVGGADVGLLSEAGLPAVADPGAAVVSAAHRLGLRVEALPGPSALMLALAASGLNGQNFAFVGYLPINDDARAARIRELDAHSRRAGQTQIAIETPYRNTALLRALIEHLSPATRLSIGCALTWPEGWSRTQTAQEWRRAGPSLGNRLPAVFLWQAS